MRQLWARWWTSFLVSGVVLLVALPGRADEAVPGLSDAVERLLAHANDPVRIAVLPVRGSGSLAPDVVERQLVRVLLDRQREDVVTPARVQHTLSLVAAAQSTDQDVPTGLLRGLACDHVLVPTFLTPEVLSLKLIHVERGEVVYETRAALVANSKAASVDAAMRDTADQLALSLERVGHNVRLTTMAVMPTTSTPALAQSRIDVLCNSALSQAVSERGFVVVERQALDAALGQLSLSQTIDTDTAQQLGKMTAAQALLVSDVAEVGTTYVLNARVIDSETGNVMSTTTTEIPRDDAVSRAAVETRTPQEAALRSAAVVGWGQAYNGELAKAGAFFAAGAGGALLTAGLGAGAFVAFFGYQNLTPAKGESPAQTQDRAVQLRTLTNGLLWGTAVGMALTVSVWGLSIVDAYVAEPTGEGGA